jgi:hypothetical protein
MTHTMSITIPAMIPISIIDRLCVGP